MEKRGKIRSKEKGEENENITDKGETNLFIVCLQPPRDKLINLIHSPPPPPSLLDPRGEEKDIQHVKDISSGFSIPVS